MSFCVFLWFRELVSTDTWLEKILKYLLVLLVEEVVKVRKYVVNSKKHACVAK